MKARILSKYAPVALFVYNRPDHTRKTIESLKTNFGAQETSLFIFSDAPSQESERFKVDQVRDYLHTVTGFSEVRITESKSNLGLANSIIDGVTKLCNLYGRVIVLEDDLLTSPYFLTYMNDALDTFNDDLRVSAISGYMFPVEHEFENKIFLRSTPLSWGWATWERAWSNLNQDGAQLLSTLKSRKMFTDFNYSGPQAYGKMLLGQISGKNNSWFVRWCATLFLTKKLTVMPTRSLVNNIGIDGSGTHCASWRFNPYDVALSKSNVSLEILNRMDTKKLESKLKLYFIKIRVLRYVNFLYRVFTR